jgi:hypothetical protein
MGILDDAIREHLELKRRLGASDEELEQKETEAFGPAGAALRQPPAPAEPVSAETSPEVLAEEPEFQVQRTAPAEERSAPDVDPWAPEGSDEELLAPDEVLPPDSLESNGSYAPPPPVERERRSNSQDEEPHEDPLDEWEEEPAPTEDVLRETPEFLEETPEHDRLWFEQKPPKDFDLD